MSVGWLDPTSGVVTPLVAAGGAPQAYARLLPDPSHADRLRRSARIATVTAYRFAPLAAATARRLPVPRPVWASALREVFEDLGATFVKFGQLIASSPSMFTAEVADQFRACLDTGAPVPFDQIRTIVETDLGAPLEVLFTKFEQEPIGRASISVVHRAVTAQGQQVAVKVLRPGIEETVAVDLSLLGPLLASAARHTGDLVIAQIMQTVEGFREQIGEELDLRNEARAMAYYRQLIANIGLGELVVPEPIAGLCGRQVLTMEFLDGVPVDDLAAIEQLGHDPAPLVDAAVKSFFLLMVGDGTFHGDVHAGNMLLLRDGRLGILDWGIVGRLDPKTHWFVRQLVAAVLGDTAAWDDVTAHLARQYGAVLKEAAGLDDAQVAPFVRSIVEPILTQPFGQISLAAIMSAPMDQIASYGQIDNSDRSVKGLWHRLRQQRKVRALMEAEGMQTMYDRPMFLLGKQLLYFERYGKMYLADRSVFEDREFFEKALADAPAVRPADFDDPR